MAITTRAGIEALHTTETGSPGPRQARPVRCRVSKPLSKPDSGSSMVLASDRTTKVTFVWCGVRAGGRA